MGRAGRASSRAGLLRRNWSEKDILRLFKEEPLRQTVGYDQGNRHHRLPLHEHLLATWRGVRGEGDPALSWAALLHDIGKPQSAWIDENGQRRYFQSSEVPGSRDHAREGARLAREVLDRYDIQEREEIIYLISHHQFSEDQDAASAKSLEKRARRFIKKHGPRRAQKLLRLRRADLGAGKNTSRGKDAQAFREAVLGELAAKKFQQRSRDPLPRRV